MGEKQVIMLETITAQLCELSEMQKIGNSSAEEVRALVDTLS
jgi:hypothetical protein